MGNYYGSFTSAVATVASATAAAGIKAPRGTAFREPTVRASIITNTILGGSLLDL